MWWQLYIQAWYECEVNGCFSPFCLPSASALASLWNFWRSWKPVKMWNYRIYINIKRASAGWLLNQLMHDWFNYHPAGRGWGREKSVKVMLCHEFLKNGCRIFWRDRVFWNQKPAERCGAKEHLRQFELQSRRCNRRYNCYTSAVELHYTTLHYTTLHYTTRH